MLAPLQVVTERMHSGEAGPASQCKPALHRRLRTEMRWQHFLRWQHAGAQMASPGNNHGTGTMHRSPMPMQCRPHTCMHHACILYTGASSSLASPPAGLVTVK